MAQLKQLLITLINRDRVKAGLRAVEIDQFASQVGEQHCREMMRENFFSHWNRAGQRPYLRYSLAGGSDAVSENLSFSQGRVLPVAEDFARAVTEMHESMMAERPPADGHRQNLLNPQHTHVGIGFSYNDQVFYLAEEFLDRYVELPAITRSAAAGKDIEFKGKLLVKDVEFSGISVCYEPVPLPLEPDALNKLGSYGLPTDEMILRPRLAGALYSDGGSGDIDFDRGSGRFSCRIRFPKKREGFYTIVVWLKRGQHSFPATNVSIEVH